MYESCFGCCCEFLRCTRIGVRNLSEKFYSAYHFLWLFIGQKVKMRRRKNANICMMMLVATHLNIPMLRLPSPPRRPPNSFCLKYETCTRLSLCFHFNSVLEHVLYRDRQTIFPGKTRPYQHCTRLST